jgi:MazG family protein
MTHKNTQNSLDTLLEIMQDLRAPDGCPWDAAQTPQSLTPYILEETCELIEAIEQDDPEQILDELGDLLLQIVFQAQIFNERKQFDFHDVIRVISDKLIRRHPHVFDRNYESDDTRELDLQWEKIKRSEATYKKTCLADHLPEKLPALQRAQKLVSRAYRIERQMDLPDADNWALETLLNTQTGPPEDLDEQGLGLILFHLVRLAHQADIDAEAALRKMTRRVIHQLESQ